MLTFTRGHVTDILLSFAAVFWDKRCVTHQTTAAKERQAANHDFSDDSPIPPRRKLKYKRHQKFNIYSSPLQPAGKIKHSSLSQTSSNSLGLSGVFRK